MKKLFTLFVAALMLLCFAGCNNTNPKETKASGSVYYLNFKPEADEAWQALAQEYTKQTGVEVKVVTAASGTYDTILTSELGKTAAPTMFQVGNVGAVNTYGDFCMDLTGTDVYNEMTTHAFDQKMGDVTVSIGYCYESYGIIVNKALLAEAGHDISEIKDFASLKAVAEDIHARAGELGFDAFTSSGLDSSSSWRFSGHLANMPLFYQFRQDNVTSAPATVTDAYLDNYKAIWDLYTNNMTIDKVANNSAKGDQAESEFIEGKAVFFQNGTWEYAALTDGGLKPEDLQMIPIYCGVEGEENAALASGTENCWAVNKDASEEDIQATLDFMYWVVTSEEGTQMMAKAFGAVPFKAAKEPDNVFFAQANELLSQGKYNVDWAFNWTPAVEDWRSGVVSALQEYTTGGSWDAVVNAFVNGWAALYAKDH